MAIETLDSEKVRIKERVETYLQPRQPDNFRLNIVGVKRDGEYVYVVVQPDRDDIRSYDYYNVLAEVENDLEENEHLNVLLVPP
jgi:hypothetical protein